MYYLLYFKLFVIFLTADGVALLHVPKQRFPTILDQRSSLLCVFEMLSMIFWAAGPKVE